MKWYRRYLLLSPWKQLRVKVACWISLFICVNVAAVLSASRAEIATTRIKDCQQWLSLPTYGLKQAEIERAAIVRNLSAKLDGIVIQVNDEHKNIIVESKLVHNHQTWLSRADHVCVQTKADLRQVFIAIPDDRPETHWLNLCTGGVRLIYVDNMAAPPHLEFEYANDDELAAICLSSLSVQAPAYRARLEDIVSRETRYVALNEFRMSWAGYATWLVVLLAVAILLENRGLYGLVGHAADEAGLDDTYRDRLFDQLKTDWLKGEPLRRIRHRLANAARILQREQHREEDRQRRDRLQQLAGEAQAKKLEEENARRAQVARQRIAKGDTTLGQEMVRLRHDIRDQGSQVSQVLESGFFQAVAGVTDMAEPSAGGESNDQGAAQAEAPRRAEWMAIIHSCSHEIRPLERLSDDDLKELSERLRRVKRALNRTTWKQVRDRFDPNQPATFMTLVRLADEHGEAALLEHIDGRPSERLRRQPDPATLTVPRLLEGQGVILLGGDPGLEKFYIEQIEKLGGKVLLFHAGENPIRMRQQDPDLCLLMWRRCNHKAQQAARALGKPIIYLDKLSRSSFLPGAIQDLEAQLSTLS